MKNLIVAAVFILFITNVKAQDTGTGMSKELTCTEKAFNFSFKIGEKLKFSAPKMGPVEAASYKTDYIPAWTFKSNAIKPEEKHLPSFLFKPNCFNIIELNVIKKPLYESKAALLF